MGNIIISPQSFKKGRGKTIIKIEIVSIVFRIEVKRG